jgi:hypothetical protein
MTGQTHEHAASVPRPCFAAGADRGLADRARLALFGPTEEPRQGHRLLPEERQRDRTPLQPQDNRGRAGAGFPPQEGQPLNLCLVAPDPIEMDPRPCELCGLKIARHEVVDDGDGPIFYCLDLSPDEMTLPELERRAELRRQEEVAAIFARLEAMDDPSKRPAVAEPPPYQTAASTVEAFWFVVGLDDPERLEAWLLARPKDAPTLLKLMEAKRW